MKASAIYAAAIGLLVAVVTLCSFFYMEKTADYVKGQLYLLSEELAQGKSTERATTLFDEWNEKKKVIMCLTNHRDIENVSLSLIKVKQQTENGELEEAVKETETALFLVNDLVEKERFSIENIF